MERAQRRMVLEEVRIGLEDKGAAVGAAENNI